MLNNGEPSFTAMAAAAARAAHLIVDDEPLIFRDTLAYAMLGDRAEEFVQYHRTQGEHIVLAGARAVVTTRARYTEDRLALAAARSDGIAQYVIIGAGLDTFAHRTGGLAAGVRVFELDHPATQEWKRARLDGAGIDPPADPAHLTYIPVDLEAESPVEALLRSRLDGGPDAGPDAGFDAARPALFSWLGVTMYLTRDAIARTFAAIAGSLAPGTEVIVDHLLPEPLRDQAGRMYADMIMPESARRGEPWLTSLGPREMAELVAAHGLEVVEQVRQRDAVAAALWNRSDPLRPNELFALTRARVPRST
ncbi:MAG TPA: SAM-dependent methyltransferase [Streptosporangiaceae bacterium]